MRGGAIEQDFWRKAKFHPQSSLKLLTLERKASFAEIKHFWECLESGSLFDGWAQRGDTSASNQVSVATTCQPLDNADFTSMTRDQLAVHLFLQDTDSSMAKIATEFLLLEPTN